MKKLLISVILILTLLGCTVACNTPHPDTEDDPVSSGGAGESSPFPESNVTTDETSEPGESEEPLGSVYELLSKLSAQSYSKVNLDITTVTGDITLNAGYILTEKNITYSIERLNMLPTDGTLDNALPDYKKTITGTAVVENGVITSFDGEAVTLPTYDELKGAFHFSESNFQNVIEGEGTFAAHVVSPLDLLGTERELSDMEIYVEYDSTSLRKVTISYKTAGSVVTVRYDFEK